MKLLNHTHLAIIASLYSFLPISGSLASEAEEKCGVEESVLALSPQVRGVGFGEIGIVEGAIIPSQLSHFSQYIPEPGKDFTLRDIEIAHDEKIFEIKGELYSLFGHKCISGQEIKDITFGRYWPDKRMIQYKVNNKSPICFFFLPPIAQIYNMLLVDYEQDGDISFIGNLFKEARKQLGFLDFPWDYLSITLSQDAIEKRYHEFGIVQLRPIDVKVNEIMVACGNLPITGDGHQLFTKTKLKNPLNYESRYRELHAHKGLITINPELGKNPTIVALFGNPLPYKKRLSDLLPKNHYNTIYFEGYFPLGDRAITGILTESMPILEIGGKLKLYLNKSAHLAHSESSIPQAFTLWTKRKGETIDQALSEINGNLTYQEEYISLWMQEHLNEEDQIRMEDLRKLLEYEEILK